MSWEESADVDLYMASATRRSGVEVLSCNSTNATCQFPGLDCGETYNFTVTAFSQGCSSPASHSVSIQTGTALLLLSTIYIVHILHLHIHVFKIVILRKKKSTKVNVLR